MMTEVFEGGRGQIKPFPQAARSSMTSHAGAVPCPLLAELPCKARAAAVWLLQPASSLHEFIPELRPTASLNG